MNGSIRRLTTDDLPQLYRVREISFLDTTSPHDEAMRRLHERLLPYRRGYFVGDTLSSVASVLPFEMFLGGRLVKMGGLAGVQSAAEFRRRGHVRALLRHLLEEMRGQGVGYCLEYPFDPPYYGRMGWQSVVNGVVAVFPPERLLQTGAGNVGARKVEARRLEASEAAARLEPLHRAWASHYNGALDRGEGALRPFAEVVQRPWETRPRPVYEVDGGYCVIDLERKDGETELTVTDYAYSSPAGRHNLLAFLGLFAGQAKTVNLHLPVDDPLAADLQRHLQPNPNGFQARIVDVKLALAALSPSSEARFSLRVHDDFCAWNNETLLLELAPGGVLFKPWAQRPDVDLDVRALAALLLGGLTAEAALRTGLAAGRLEDIRTLAALAGGRPAFMPRADYF